MNREGFDWSIGSLSGEQVRQAGGEIVGGYAVDDKEPWGRGLTAWGYASYKANKLDTYAYWEGRAQWMLGGWNAGIIGSTNAVGNLDEARMPIMMPVYYAHDIDPDPNHFPAIEACLDGAASVVGWDRVALYGGWLLIDHFARLGKITRFCQTVAWEYGRGLHPAATLYQYDTAEEPRNNIAGVWVDRVRALRDDFGQASLYEAPAKPAGPVVLLPDGFADQLAKQTPGLLTVTYKGEKVRMPPSRQYLFLLRNTFQYAGPGTDTEHAGELLLKGTKVAIERVGRFGDRVWLLTHAGTWIPADTGSPRIEPDLPRERAKKAA